MQGVDRRTSKESVSVLKESVRTVISFTLVTALLISGTALVLARPAQAIQQPYIRLWTSSLQRANDGDVTQTGVSFSARRAPGVVQATDPTSRSVPSQFPAELASWQDVIYPAYALEIGPDEELVRIPDITAPGTWDTIATTPGTDYFAGDLVGGDLSTLYVLDLTSNELHSLNTATGADTTIGSSVPVSGQMWTGATGTADGTLYASSSDGTISYLYQVNTTTGVVTAVGEITNAPCIIDVAINAEGEMYGVDTCSDVLVQIDPGTAAGTVIGSLGFDADYAQGMDFENRSGILYLAAYNVTDARGELRIADTATGNSVLVGPFPDGAEVDALAFSRPTSTPVQFALNPGFESNWDYWQTEGYPSLSGTSHSGAVSARFLGEEVWVYQPVYIPSDAVEVSISYWLTGLSSDPDWDNDILCGGLWDLARQTQLGGGCFGLTYFYSYPMEWKTRTYDLDAAELASVAGKVLLLGFREKQDWLPGYHKTSTAWVDDIALLVTRPIYDYNVLLPLVIR